MATDNTKGIAGPVLYSGEPHQLVPSSATTKQRCQRVRDGAILSLLPDGTTEYKPAATDGAYEQCTVQGDALVYAYYDDPNSHPDHIARPHVHVVAWKGNLPGLS